MRQLVSAIAPGYEGKGCDINCGDVMPTVRIMDDYYAILDVPHTATLEVITKSYRRLARTLHPDKNPNKPSATASFQNVTSPPFN